MNGFSNGHHHSNGFIDGPQYENGDVQQPQLEVAEPRSTLESRMERVEAMLETLVGL